MSDPNRALIETADFPLGNTRDAVVGAHVKSITPYTEAQVKEHARKQALAAMPFGNKGLPALLSDLAGNILGGLAEVIRAVAAGGVFIVSKAFEAVGGLLRGVFDMLSGLIKPMQENIRDGLSGQLALNDRLDLLEGTAGYVCAYMSVSIDGSWSRQNTRDLPFKSQVGPNKNAHIDTEHGMLVLDAKGLWTFSGRTHVSTSKFPGSDYCYLDLIVYTPEGNVYHEVHEEFVTPRDREQTILLATEPVVIDRPGYKAKLRIYMGNWRVFMGGTKYSSFSAIRHSHDVIHHGRQTVPLESE